VNGFCRKGISLCRTPWRTTLSSVYPDMQRTFVSGRVSAMRFASSPPPIPGITTSVKQMNHVGVRLRERERGVGARGDEDMVPTAFEDGLGDEAYRLLILDQEHRLRAAKIAIGIVGRRGVGCGCGCGCDARQVHLERRTGPRLAVDPHRTAGLLHDAEDGRQPEARASSHLFRSEEGLEDAGLRRAVHAAAGVADRQHHVRAARCAEVTSREVFVELGVRGLDRELAARWHGVTGVDHKVHDDLLDVARVDHHAAEVRTGHEDEVDVFAKDSLQHRAHS
jgi:hypothetical protein